MVAAPSVEELRSQFRWHRVYQQGADAHPETYASRLTPRRMSLLIGTLADAHGEPLATLWVQQPSLPEPVRRLRSHQDAKGRPVFAVLLREGGWWRLVGLFLSVSSALEVLATALAGGMSRAGSTHG